MVICCSTYDCDYCTYSYCYCCYFEWFFSFRVGSTHLILSLPTLGAAPRLAATGPTGSSGVPKIATFTVRLSVHERALAAPAVHSAQAPASECGREHAY